MGSWRESPGITMAGLGLLSGVVSAIWGMSGESNLDWLQPVAALFVLAPELLPIGLYFGAAIAAGVWMHTRNWWCVPVLLITTVYAWSAAIQVAIRTQRHTGDDPHLIGASLAAGAVGAGLTHLGCTPFAPGAAQARSHRGDVRGRRRGRHAVLPGRAQAHRRVVALRAVAAGGGVLDRHGARRPLRHA